MLPPAAVENKVDFGRLGYVVLVPGVVGNFPVVRSNKNQLLLENPLRTLWFPPTTSTKGHF